MTYPVSTNDLNSTLEFFDELPGMVSRAEAYLSGFKWCRKIKSSLLFYNLGTTLCVFLFDIENSQSKVEGDCRLWVIVGDLPAMYLDTNKVKSLKEAIECYADLAEEWADHIIAKKSLKNCFPFNEEPGIALARLLKSRVEFINSNLLKNITDIKFN